MVYRWTNVVLSGIGTNIYCKIEVGRTLRDGYQLEQEYLAHDWPLDNSQGRFRVWTIFRVHPTLINHILDTAEEIFGSEMRIYSTRIYTSRLVLRRGGIFGEAN